MKTIKILAGISLSCVVLSAVSLRAQPAVENALQQQANFQRNMEQEKPLLGLKAGTNAPETYPGENSDIGAQHIMRIIPHRTYWEFRADSEYLYTDNAQLTQNGKVESTEFVNSISAAFAPSPYKLGYGRFSPSVGFMSQWYNYGLGGNQTIPGNLPISTMDFNVQTAFARAQYLMQDSWTLFGEFDYTRLLDQNSPPGAYRYQEFYQDYTSLLGVQKVYSVSDKSVLAASLQADYHDSWTATTPNDAQNRIDGTFSLSYSYAFKPSFVVQPYYRFQYTRYNYNSSQNGVTHAPIRNDYLNSVGFSAAYYYNPQWGPITPNFSLRAFINYDAKSSDDIQPQLGGAQRYHDYTVGLDLACTLRF